MIGVFPNGSVALEKLQEFLAAFRCSSFFDLPGLRFFRFFILTSSL
jgi:hypothetical protein